MFRKALGSMTSPGFMLAAIKVAHTIVWLFFVACIVAIWAFAWSENLRHATWSIGIVLVEVIALAMNDLRCPLTPIAARYTVDRPANFDIYLPEYLARHSKLIFGGLYAGGIVFTFARWVFAAQ